jgi:anti-anti-sigma factor
MTRKNAASPGGEPGSPGVEHVQYEPDPTTAEAPPRARGRLERPARAPRLRGGSPAGGHARPPRETLVRTHRLVLSGELGRDSAVALEAEIDTLCESGIDELVLDLARLRRIDATGVYVLATRCEVCRRRGVLVELAGASAEVRRAFAAADLADRLPPEAPLPEAPTRLAGGAVPGRS